MQRPRELVIVASGLSQPYPLDRYVNGYGFTVISNGHQYTLQYSNSDPNYDAIDTARNGRPTPYSTSYNVSGKWKNWDDTAFVNASATQSTNFAFPARAIRINVSAAVSAGNPLILQIVPMGMDAN